MDRHQDKSQALPIFDPELPTDSIHKNSHALRLAYIGVAVGSRGGQTHQISN
jgi:hypothetical protein